MSAVLRPKEDLIIEPELQKRLMEELGCREEELRGIQSKRREDGAQLGVDDRRILCSPGVCPHQSQSGTVRSKSESTICYCWLAVFIGTL